MAAAATAAVKATVAVTAPAAVGQRNAPTEPSAII